ncbi:NAD(P)-binding protein [Xylariaceae sp. FL0594]|nr:NAD(P)-binding protein [Xylariaceae sp. FL0594]
MKAGFKVRAPIRSAEKGELVTKIFHERYGADAFSTVLIPDMSVEGSLDEALRGCAGVVHGASEMGFSPDPHQMITPTLNMLNNILRTAARTSSVKRVVTTSSQAVMPSIAEPGHQDASSWTPQADGVIAYAWAEPYTPEKAGAVYAAGKISSERACWHFVKSEKPGFVLNTVVPGFTIGATLHPDMPVTSSNSVVRGMLESVDFAVGFLKVLSPTNFVDLRDCALLHLAALANADIQGQRLLALGEAFDFDKIVDILAELQPENNLPEKLTDGARGQATIDTRREQELLKAMGKEDGFTSLKESIRLCIVGETQI